MHRQVLKVNRKMLDLKHLDMLASMSNLARALDSQGKYKTAEEMH